MKTPLLKEYVIDKFKGINRLGNRFNMEPYWIWDLLNAYVKKTDDGKGKIQQRWGLAKLNSTILNDSSTKIRYLFEARWDNGTKDIIARAYDGWYRYNSGTGAFVALDTGRSTDARGFACMFQDNLIMVDGGVPRKSDSSYSVSDLSSDASMPQDSTACWVHQHRVWLNSSSNPMKVYGSKVDDATGANAWSTASDSVTLDLSQVLPEGDTILGFRTMGDVMLVILCINHIVIYNAPTTYTDISLVQIIKTGALSNYAIAQLGNDWVYPAASGINSLVSSIAYQKLDVDDLTKYIAPLYRNYLDSVSDHKDVCGIYFHRLNHYYITLPIGSESQTLVYGLDFKNFVGRFVFNGINPYSWLETESGALYVGGDNGYIYTYDDINNNDDGSTIEFQWHLPFLGIDTPNNYKAPREFEALIDTNYNVTLYLDYWFGLTEYGTGAISKTITISATASLWREATWRSSLWRAAGRELYKSYDLLERGKLMGMILRHNTLNARVSISYLIIKTILEGDK